MSDSQAPSIGTPRFLQDQEGRISQEIKDMMSTLPQEKSWFSPSLYQYQGFWHAPIGLQGMLLFQKHFEARDTDIFIATPPKCGTTWLKATLFALINRAEYPVAGRLLKDHPLLHKNPHELVRLIENELSSDYRNVPDFSSTPPPRLFNTHLPIVSMPESVKESKIVYMCRDPKDAFLSLWHFVNKMRPSQNPLPLEEGLDMFCKGVSPFGPFWDNVLGYWKASLENPGKLLFLKYEEMKKDPLGITKRIAEFLGCSFSLEEEETGVVEDVVKLCSFDNLSSLEVNKKGELPSGLGRNIYFRKGEVGRWANELSPDMVMRIDQVTEHKISGTGFRF